MIVTNKISQWVVSLASRFTPGTDAVTIWPFIFVWPKEFLEDSRLIRHEKKHLEQWKRYWIIGFLPVYLYHHCTKGYEKNPLEIEAKEAQNAT